MTIGIRKMDFDEIKSIAERGEDINQLTEHGCSFFTALLERYYSDLMKEIEQNERQVLPREYDHRGSLDRYQTEPLEKRKDGILDILEWFMDHKVDLNLVDAENDYCETPLSLTLWYEDYYMMKYLLEHGADPKVWYSPTNERFDEFETELIDSLDCAMIHTAGNEFRNQKRLVWLLMDYGMPISGIYRYIYEAEEEYQKWHAIVDGKDPKELSREELFDVLYELSRKDIVDYGCIKKYLDCFSPWDEEHSYEKLFAQAFYGRNVELFKMLYDYCPHPDYSSDYMCGDVLFDSHFVDEEPMYKNDIKTPADREKYEREECNVIESGLDMIKMIHFMFTHPDAVEAYKDSTGTDESMFRHLRWEVDNERDEIWPLQLQQIKRVLIEITAFHVYTDDYGPRIIKEFDLDRLDEYRLNLDGPDDTYHWQFFDYNNELVAEF